MRMTALITAFAMALGVAACGKKDEPAKTTTAPPTPSTAPAPAAGVAVSSLTVGNAIGPDKRIAAAAAAAALVPKDTIYVSIDTTGTGLATLKSRWTYLKDGKSTLVTEVTQQVSASGPAAHEFHISKADGWPKGDYQVEVFVNDAPAGTKRFTVT